MSIMEEIRTAIRRARHLVARSRHGILVDADDRREAAYLMVHLVSALDMMAEMYKLSEENLVFLRSDQPDAMMAEAYQRNCGRMDELRRQIQEVVRV